MARSWIPPVAVSAAALPAGAAILAPWERSGACFDLGVVLLLWPAATGSAPNQLAGEEAFGPVTTMCG